MGLPGTDLNVGQKIKKNWIMNLTIMDILF